MPKQKGIWMKNKVIFTGMLIAGTSAAAFEPQWSLSGFDMPESAIFDEVNNRIIVSIIGGNPTDTDGIGGLALVSANGEMLDSAWVTGLNAPKGLAIIDERLIVADLTQLHEVDLGTGEILNSIDVPDAVFLNDVVTDGERAYVSDFMADKIYEYEDGVISIWLEDEKLENPNGLFVDDGNLIVGSWGADMQDDFSTLSPGSLLSVDIESRDIEVVAQGLGNLDGITKIDETILVSDWISGDLFSVEEGDKAMFFHQFPAGLADISSYGEVVLMPSMLEGKLSAYSYPFGQGEELK